MRWVYVMDSRNRAHPCDLPSRFHRSSQVMQTEPMHCMPAQTFHLAFWILLVIVEQVCSNGRRQSTWIEPLTKHFNSKFKGRSTDLPIISAQLFYLCLFGKSIELSKIQEPCVIKRVGKLMYTCFQSSFLIHLKMIYRWFHNLYLCFNRAW